MPPPLETKQDSEPDPALAEAAGDAEEVPVLRAGGCGGGEEGGGGDGDDEDLVPRLG